MIAGCRISALAKPTDCRYQENAWQAGGEGARATGGVCGPEQFLILRNYSTRQLLPAIVPVLLVIFGIKLVLIDRYGTITPYWDQWNGEGLYIYKPFLSGQLTLQNLIASHNEHRIFFSRILSLLELEAFGVWFPELQMGVNAVIHTAAIGLLLWLLLPALDTAGRMCALFATLILYAVPFGYENTLGAFQSPFYFLFAFSLISVWLFHLDNAFSVRWFAALFFGIASYFNIASGALTILAGFSLCSLQIILGARDRSRKELAALAVLLAVVSVELAYIHHVQKHDALQTRGLLDFAASFLMLAAWPFPPILAIIVNAPMVCVLIKLFRGRPAHGAYPWLLTGLFFWLGTQWLALVYGRGEAVLAGRYLDTLVLGPILNVAALAWLTQSFRDARLATSLALVGFLLALSYVVALSSPTVLRGAAAKGERYAKVTATMQAYLKSGDIGRLENKAIIPYPDPKRLAQMASDPTIRSILHPGLTGSGLRADMLLPGWLTWLFRASFILLVGSGQLIIGVGLGLMIAAVSRIARARKAPLPHSSLT